MSKNTQENRLVQALTRNSLYTFEFDVSIGLVEEEIVDRNGVNFTKILGLSVPCSFDAMMERAFGQALECRYTSESSITTLSRQALLDAFAEDVEESRSAGMNEHISKPLDIGKVKMTIARYIGRKRS